MIIWGSKGSEVEVSAGQFFCPRCEALRQYKHKRIAKYFTLYFIPLFQTENLGEYIECQTCSQTYTQEILTYKPPSPTERAIVAIRADLDSGTPMQMALRKLLNSQVEGELATSLVLVAAGENKRTCSTCKLTYRATVILCSNCSKNLEGVPSLTQPG